ncbi:NUDIX hydrolase [Phenylobacterium sp.]|jgi:8-oxo-dGTP pyrophosphatase MutT (NUDIX family)|uniref:NUDIX hydrolase n=1 Tax=Phenylobacterium sp. TaxID=1871053 RepID=UPI002F938A79
MGRKADIRVEPDREPREQYAALPWRRGANGAVEVLLITSRETRRWVIPKGWPIKGLKSPKSAAREAYEEAGVTGDVGKQKVGVYHYEKRLASGRLQHVKVTVYPLRVEAEADSWPEKGQREKLWTSIDDAAPRVAEPELQSLIAAFRPK